MLYYHVDVGNDETIDDFLSYDVVGVSIQGEIYNRYSTVPNLDNPKTLLYDHDVNSILEYSNELVVEHSLSLSLVEVDEEWCGMLIDRILLLQLYYVRFVYHQNRYSSW
mmetsp:Transcript_17086/g.23753  ORF Transcript_17086/g.23753 Transcript_17086/m.23753 type:complete len:109 (+) Transcript_17086:209-535(+)